MLMLSEQTFWTPHRLAGRVGVPALWLIEEAAAGRLPHLRADGRFYFNPEAVERALRKRTALHQKEALSAK